jgi:PadR family transcriptional regulator, regulatory protein PadR
MGQNDVPPGTLTLMVLRTLDQMGPLHGYGIARRIEQVSGDRLQLNQGTIYPALLQLEQNGWIKGSWGVSENNRRARYYAITRAGRRRLAAEEDRWRVASETILRFLAPAPPSGRGAS